MKEIHFKAENDIELYKMMEAFFNGFYPTDKNETFTYKAIQQHLFSPEVKISELNISTKLLKSLMYFFEDINKVTLRELSTISKEEYLKQQNFGKIKLLELKKILNKAGLGIISSQSLITLTPDTKICNIISVRLSTILNQVFEDINKVTLKELSEKIPLEKILQFRNSGQKTYLEYKNLLNNIGSEYPLRN